MRGIGPCLKSTERGGFVVNEMLRILCGVRKVDKKRNDSVKERFGDKRI